MHVFTTFTFQLSSNFAYSSLMSEAPPGSPTLGPDDVHLDFWLNNNLPQTEPEIIDPADRDTGTWVEIRLFISSTFVDTQVKFIFIFFRNKFLEVLWQIFLFKIKIMKGAGKAIDGLLRNVCKSL